MPWLAASAAHAPKRYIEPQFLLSLRSLAVAAFRIEGLERPQAKVSCGRTAGLPVASARARSRAARLRAPSKHPPENLRHLRHSVIGL